MRRTSTRRPAMVAALLMIGCGWMAPARADIALATPAGLTSGDQFRFVFVTDGTMDATSTNISDYDDFAQSQADGATYNGVEITWQAIGSTASVNAIDHIGRTDTPVYLVDGTEVASSTTSTGLWSGALMHAIDEEVSGQRITNGVREVFTGTDYDGLTSPGFPLGGGPFGYIIVGSSVYSSSKWAYSGTTHSNDLFRIYAISAVETVPQAATPEPSSMLLLCTGGVMFGAYGWTRRHRDRPQGAVVESRN